MSNTNPEPKLIGGAVAALVIVAIVIFGFIGLRSNDTELAAGVPDQAEQTAVRQSEEFQLAMVDAEQNASTLDEGVPEMNGDPQVTLTGNFEDNVINGYDVTGQAQILVDGDERVLRLEDFSTPSGPALKVYLRAENGEYISLGDLQATSGSQNYVIPDDVDLSIFNAVDIWCEPFGVGFGLANLA